MNDDLKIWEEKATRDEIVQMVLKKEFFQEGWKERSVRSAAQRSISFFDAKSLRLCQLERST
jgi:hypothetical protein